MPVDKEVAERFGALASQLRTRAGVTFAGGARRAFGSGALKVNGRIFAMLSSKGRFVVKLPAERVAELVAGGKGSRFDPGHGRVMKEWFETDEVHLPTWRALAIEALKFGRGGTPGRRPRQG